MMVLLPSVLALFICRNVDGTGRRWQRPSRAVQHLPISVGIVRLLGVAIFSHELDQIRA